MLPAGCRQLRASSPRSPERKSEKSAIAGRVRYPEQ